MVPTTWLNMGPSSAPGFLGLCSLGRPMEAWQMSTLLFMARVVTQMSMPNWEEASVQVGLAKKTRARSLGKPPSPPLGWRTRRL